MRSTGENCAFFSVQTADNFSPCCMSHASRPCLCRWTRVELRHGLNDIGSGEAAGDMSEPYLPSSRSTLGKANKTPTITLWTVALEFKLCNVTISQVEGGRR